MDKILIIDDSSDVCENFAELLRHHNYEVHTAGNGQAGINLAMQLKPDLILCDIHMPQPDGFDVFYNLKTEKSTKLIPFIFLTASDNTAYRCKSLDAGADDFISKWIGEEELISVIGCRIRKTQQITENLSAQGQQYISELQNLLHTLSHSVRSPLCTNLGLINLLELKNRIASSDEELKVIIEGIKNNTLRLDDCTKDFTKQLNALVERTNRSIQGSSSSDKDHHAA